MRKSARQPRLRSKALLMRASERARVQALETWIEAAPREMNFSKWFYWLTYLVFAKTLATR